MAIPARSSKSLFSFLKSEVEFQMTTMEFMIVMSLESQPWMPTAEMKGKSPVSHEPGFYLTGKIRLRNQWR